MANKLTEQTIKKPHVYEGGNYREVPYEHKAFPKWKYSADKPARVVQDEAAEKALGEGWFDNPAAAEEAAANAARPKPQSKKAE